LGSAKIDPLMAAFTAIALVNEPLVNASENLLCYLDPLA
jgi:hypothetical protein